MLFQIAASVAQVGFGHLADRWRPRTLVMVGPVVAVSVLSFVGTATVAADARVHPDHRRARRRSVSPACCSIGSSARRRAPGTGDVGLHHGRNLRVLAGPVDVRTVCAALRARVDADPGDSGRRWSLRSFSRACRRCPCTRHREAASRPLSRTRSRSRSCTVSSSSGP